MKKQTKTKPKTMGEEYGIDDYPDNTDDHLCCPNCGMCIDCGDCSCKMKKVWIKKGYMKAKKIHGWDK